MTDKELINFVEPSDFVEIYLNDGRVLRGRKGTELKFFLQKIDNPIEPVIVGAIVNGELKELSFVIDFNSKVKPVTLNEEDGARIYRRSLTFLLEATFTKLFPGFTLTIDHAVASGGYYCQISGGIPLTDSELDLLEREMRGLVNQDLPIHKDEIPLNEAVQFFEECGKSEKVRLLHYRQKSYLTIYCLEEYQDYHHGFMVPSTGYLKWFKLVPTNGGFTIRFPSRETPTILSQMKEYPKLLSSFRQYGEWLDKLEISNVGALNDAINNNRSQEIILVSEAFHEQHVSEIAYQIQKNLDETQVVIIAGPSSSGKTTFSKKLSVALLARGISPVPIEMDNYFVNREMTPKDEKGDFNFEDIHALNLLRLENDLSMLMKGSEIQLPVYNFITGNSEPGEIIRLHKDEILLIEGIHGLNPELLPNLQDKKIYRIYVSALTQLNLDRNNRISTTDTRLIRRITRDTRKRGFSAQTTILRWPSVHRGEKKNIFPFQENADIMFNSALVYELSVLKPLVEPLLLQVPQKTPEYLEAKRLISLLEWFLPIEGKLIPDDSILREFIGGSNLENFKPWNH